MSSAAVELRPAATPVRVGQATAVEQSRAVAEVQAAVIVAQQCPRSTTAAVRAMEEACRQPALAGRAFFRYPRAGETVSGPSVHLARELARCWGNVQHGITELSRDDAHGQSEMQAWAWDVQTNTRSSNTFIVQHKRDTKTGVKDLTDQRDIYENNANNGARRLREAIFSVLPTWYTEQAKELCQATNENGGGKPLATRIADAVRVFEKLRVGPARLAAKFGYASVDELTATDVAQLGVVYESLRQGTVTVDEEFPAEPDRVTAAEVTARADAKPAARSVRKVAEPKDRPTGAASAAASAEGSAPAVPASGQTAPPEPEDDTPEPPPDSEEYQGALRAAQAQAGRVIGKGDEHRDERLMWASRIVPDAAPVQSFSDLTAAELVTVASVLGKVRDVAALEQLLSAGEVPGDGE